mmetsp:Transcript_59248/g.94008  ORF Transcript_59248/g.94008 Transcript_59248/m.94008 type:complete len:229 (+) Transcript_59248:49-735(+)
MMRSGRSVSPSRDEAAERKLEQELAGLDSKLAKVEKKSKFAPSKRASPQPKKKPVPKSVAKSGEVPHYLQPTETFKRNHEQSKNVRDEAKADHDRAWNAGMRRSISKSPPPQLPKVNPQMSEGVKPDDKQRSNRDVDTASIASVRPRISRVPQKQEPAPPDPEVDLGVALGLVQLPCTDVLLAKVTRGTIHQRFGSLLERILPTERRLPRPPTELTLQSIPNSIGQDA